MAHFPALVDFDYLYVLQDAQRGGPVDLVQWAAVRRIVEMPAAQAPIATDERAALLKAGEQVS